MCVAVRKKLTENILNKYCKYSVKHRLGHSGFEFKYFQFMVLCCCDKLLLLLCKI